MMDERALVSIGIAGPRGVGKTSLIASILKSGNDALLATPVTLAAATPRAQVRIDKFHDHLTGWLAAGGFVGDRLKPTQDVDELPFQLTIQDDPELGIRFDAMDYPGSLLSAVEHSDDREKVKAHLRRSTVLIVPVDASLVMEAIEPAQKAGRPTAIYLSAVSSVILQWAKDRADNPDEPAILVIAPVKCESYVADNGGRIDETDRLRTEVLDLFDEAISNAAKAVRDADFAAWYCPVDTIGCIEIESARWKVDGEVPRLEVDYVVRPPGRLSPKGAKSLLHLIANHIVTAKRRLAEHESLQAQQMAEAHAQKAAENRGFWGNIWWSVNGQRKNLKNAASASQETADRFARRMQAVEQALEKLAVTPDEGRLTRVE